MNVCHWGDAARDLVGTRLAGTWHLDELRGVGGTSAVFAATHPNGRRSAIKVLAPHIATHAGARTRLLREAYIANKLAEYGSVPVWEDGIDGAWTFLVMDLLEGETLGGRARARGGRLPLDEALALADGLLATLAEAHAMGIVHRDVKPANVFIERSGRVRLLDFGMARIEEWASVGPSGSANRARSGTPAFMAPEQACGRAREIDARADVWGAAATLFAVLTGHFVHEAPSVAEMIFLCGTQPAPPIATRLPEVPPAIGQVVDRALALQPSDRWESGGAMRSALRRARYADPLAPRPAGAGFRASLTLPEEGRVPTRTERVEQDLPEDSARRVFVLSKQPRVLSNTYVLGRVLGEGGTGIVYQATNRLTRQTVALKQLRWRQDAPGRDNEERLLLAREFRTLASLHHPNVVRVFDYGFDDTWGAYFTMEMLAAPRDILSATKDRSNEGKLTAWIELLRALSYLHRRHVIHHDLKPSNVLVDGEKVKVVDFGIAVEDDGQGRAAGTLGYMAPELFLGGAPTAASDLFSAGVVAYEMFAGRLPYDMSCAGTLLSGLFGRPLTDADLQKTMVSFAIMALGQAGLGDAFDPKMRRPIPRLEGLGSLTDPLNRVILKLLSPRAEDRYASVEEVVAELNAGLERSLEIDTIDTRESFLRSAEFVGREEELAALSRALERLTQGKGSAWLVGGESGVGKSRLLDEARTVALVAGVRVARGQAVVEASRPFHVWNAIVHALCLDAVPTDEEANILSDVIPELESFLGRPVTAAPPAAPQVARARIFGVIEALMRRQTQPLLVILEDLQWAGSESVELLGLVAKLADGLPILFVATNRDDERPEIGAALSGLNSIKLGRLTAGSIERLSESMLGPAGRHRAVVEYLHRETEGNVFFLIEVVRALAEEAGRLDGIGADDLRCGVLTGGIERILGRRLAKVPASGHALLELAATAGREIEPVVLARFGSPEVVEDWLIACANASVLESRDGRWWFAHDKLREHLLRQIDADRRPVLHLRVAEAIEATYGSAREKAGVLAEHFAHAGRYEKAHRYFICAGDDAAALNAPIEARQHFGAALEALARLPDTLANRRHRVDALVRNARVSWVAVNPDEYIGLLDRAEASLATDLEREETHDVQRRAHLKYWKGRFLYVRGTPDLALASHEEATVLAERAGDDSLGVWLSASVGQAYFTQGHFRDSLPYLEKARAPMARSEEWAEWSRVTGFVGMALCSIGRLSESDLVLDRAMAKAREIKNTTGVALVLLYRTIAACLWEDWARAVDAAVVAKEAALEARDDMLVYLVLQQLTWALSWLGRHDEAAEHRRDAARVASILGRRCVLYDWFAAAEADQAMNEGRPHDAIGLARAAIDLARASGGVYAEGLGLRVWARALTELGPENAKEANARFAESLRIHEAAGAAATATRTRLLWAETCRRRGDMAASEELLRYAAQNDEAFAAMAPASLLSSRRRTVPPSARVE
jgi:serine/threonine protein kinase/tetratricopeptide (TPR) repeat protein